MLVFGNPSLAPELMLLLPVAHLISTGVYLGQPGLSSGGRAHPEHSRGCGGTRPTEQYNRDHISSKDVIPVYILPQTMIVEEW